MTGPGAEQEMEEYDAANANAIADRIRDYNLNKIREKVAHAATFLEGHPDYRILRRIKPEMMPDLGVTDGCKLAVFVDCEATGVDPKTADIIQIGMVPFYYDNLMLRVVRVMTPWYGFQQPPTAITDKIRDLTGITNDMVAGQSIDWDQAAQTMQNASLVIAHSAQYDRPLIERYCPVAAQLPWACTVEQVPWQDEGISGRKLEYIASSMGYFYDAHQAIADCYAGVFCIDRVLRSGKTGLQYLLEKAGQETRRVWAVSAPFEKKDTLKERGYSWNGGEDGRPKAWHKEVSMIDYEPEIRFLQSDAVYGRRYPPLQVTKVTATSRFTIRG